MSSEFIPLESEKVIAEIRKRPVLYDSNMIHYCNRSLRKELWAEVCQEVVEDWDKLSKSAKRSKMEGVQQKWKNLKDSYRREIKKQKLSKEGIIKKKRKYLYSDQLNFMLPFINNKTVSQTPSDDGKTEDTEEHKIELTEHSVGASNEEYNVSGTEFNNYVDVKEENNFDDVMPQVFIDQGADDIDEDKFFLLSLLPSFRKLTPQQKMQIKMEFLQSLNKTMFPHS
ncbi:uncharacterized protein LOC115882954 [Sitophilus oryzae]|uniref:Uncharacterized protein LOC115882954 n=1 Tax=Sitophilus oryzae TaxID=7048 RepID=A0A6J2Y017_SITOR|nr:uncharacterized protein LOC115882954 [Sitophilus oryzae]